MTSDHPNKANRPSDFAEQFKELLQRRKRVDEAVRKRLKTLMQRYPAIFNPIWAAAYPYFRRGSGEVVSEFQDNVEAFSKIHSDNLWGSSESLSGWGSTLAYTAVMRKHLERLLTDMKVRTLLDAPCGDFNWMAHVSLPPEASYIGGEIVPDLVTSLNQRYGTNRHAFRAIDIVRGPIPRADLWLCRDVLFHLRNEDALSVLRNFVASDVPFLLTTTYDFVRQNGDTRPGGFRYINLRLPPFGLGKPRLKIPDFLAPAPPRYLALWSHKDVKASLSA